MNRKNRNRLLIGAGVCAGIAAVTALIAYSRIQREVGMGRSPREMGAILRIGEIQRAQRIYKPRFKRYAASLGELAADGLIAPGFVSGSPNGYVFVMQSTPGGYTIHANPVGAGGLRTFFSDQTLVVRENRSPRPATANDSEIK